MKLVEQVKFHGSVRDPRVLKAVETVPRHLFVPGEPVDIAYEDRPLPIGHGQTISQPTVVAMMSEALDLHGSERVLEIGTGSGYQAAILTMLAKEVYSIEVVEPLAKEAGARLKELGYSVNVRAGDGYRGWPEAAPFDRIIVTAAPPEIPKALLDQLAEGGVLVAPVGQGVQQLVRIRKEHGELHREHLGLVVFVPMVPGK
jgi:protein-L-isoaspartate(D-aspartate) O-methyltransferase